jgi:tripartite-type tricarboxylate transporter receptor subunit TctC
MPIIKVCLAVAAAALMQLPSGVVAQSSYPDRPIRMIVPFPAGGFIDGVGRIVADRMSVQLGTPVVIENRGGASGKVGEDLVLSANPDGYTILIASVSRPTLMQQVNAGAPDRDILADFDIISLIGSAPFLMLFSPKFGPTNALGVFEKTKAEPGKHSYGTIGVGTPSPLMSQIVAKRLSLDVGQVPYTGGADAVRDLAAGVIVWLFATPGDSLGLIQSGDLLPGFVVNATRIKQLPEVPTAAELGFPEITDQNVGLYIMVRKGTVKYIVERLNQAIADAQKDAALVQRLNAVAFIQPNDYSAAAAFKMATAEITNWEQLLKIAGVR